MLVYQLKVIELGECLEPVFKTKENALLIKEKYKTRNIILKEHYLSLGLKILIYVMWLSILAQTTVMKKKNMMP